MCLVGRKGKNCEKKPHTQNKSMWSEYLWKIFMKMSSVFLSFAITSNKTYKKREAMESFVP